MEGEYKMFYLVKDLKWSKARNQDLFYTKEDYACGKSDILHAGIFFEEDKDILHLGRRLKKEL